MTVSRLLPLSVFVCLAASGRGRPAAAAPLPFDAPPFPAIFYGGSPTPGGLNGVVAQFEPRGPIAGTIQAAKVKFEHVAVDPRGPTPTYYGGFGWHSGVGPARFDPATGTVTPLAVPDDEIVDWPTGLTFDSTRNRLLVSTLGGTGYIHAYAPETNRWTRLADLAQVDLWSLTYSANYDTLFALSAGKILRYTPEGRPAGQVPLQTALPAGLDLRYSQLVATGDKLVLLTQPMADPLDARLPGVQRSYLIDPAAGSVTSLGPVRVVPEPASLGLQAAAAGAARRVRRSRPGR